MTIILLQQPAINRAEEYKEWRAKWGTAVEDEDTCMHAHLHTHRYTDNLKLHTKGG